METIIRAAPQIDTHHRKPSECDHLSVHIIGGNRQRLFGKCEHCNKTVQRVVTKFERATGKTEVWWR